MLRPRDENTCRKDFTPTEEHALYEALLELEKPKALHRSGTRRSSGLWATIGLLSGEPLLSSLVGFDLSGIGWVIAGGESGIPARPVQPWWISELRRECQGIADVPMIT